MDSGDSVLCGCGCGQIVAWRGGKPGKWAEDGCRQRHWNLTHPVLDLRGLSVVEAERARRMAEEAVNAAREGLKRATVDVLPVKHDCRDNRPSCRVRVDEEVWDDLEFLMIVLGLSSRSAVVRKLVSTAMRRVAAELAGGGRMNPDEEYVNRVCQPGKGSATCSFLMIGPGGFCCAKGTSVEPILQRRRAERDMVALSDNCSGPPDFTLQGDPDGQDPA